jgi:hypothetical protein
MGKDRKNKGVISCHSFSLKMDKVPEGFLTRTTDHYDLRGRKPQGRV